MKHQPLAILPSPGANRLASLLRAATFAILFALLAWPAAARLSDEQAEEHYRQGQDALAEGRYTEAADQFRALSTEASTQVDRAMYWQAYAETKAGRKQAATSTLDRLTKTYPESPWIDDAQALRLELGGKGSERAIERAMDESDEDLKLYALDALQQADPERAVTLLDEFLRGNHSLRLKQHALFVLAQTESPRAGKILTAIARDPKNPDLQREAIMALGVSDEPAAIAALGDIYRGTSSVETKRQILNAMVASDAATLTADLAIAEKDLSLRREAIMALGAMEASAELERVAKALGPSARPEIFQAYGIADDAGPLLRVLRESNDSEELQAAIQGLAIADSDEATAKALLDLYKRTPDRSVKISVLNAFMIEDDAKTLIEVFRGEKDPDLKRQALQYLSMMDDPEVQNLIEQLLKG